jgi:hypothetical protein
LELFAALLCLTTACLATALAFIIAAELKHGLVFSMTEYATLVLLLWARSMWIVSLSYFINPSSHKPREASIASVLLWPSRSCQSCRKSELVSALARRKARRLPLRSRLYTWRVALSWARAGVHDGNGGVSCDGSTALSMSRFLDSCSLLVLG